MQLGGLLQQVLCLIGHLAVGDHLTVQVIRHAASGLGHIVGGGGPHGYVHGFVVAEGDGPAALRDHNGAGGGAGVHLIILYTVDDRLGDGPLAHHAHHGEGFALHLDDAADGVLSGEQALGRRRIDDGHLAAGGEILRQEGTTVIHLIARHGEIVVVHAVEGAGEGLVAGIDAVGPRTLAVHGHGGDAGQSVHLVPHGRRDGSDALRQLPVGEVHGAAVLRQLHLHHVVAGTDEVLLDLLVGTTDGGDDGDDGGNADDDAQHGQKRPQLMAPHALQRQIDIFQHSYRLLTSCAGHPRWLPPFWLRTPRPGHRGRPHSPPASGRHGSGCSCPTPPYRSEPSAAPACRPPHGP